MQTPYHTNVQVPGLQSNMWLHQLGGKSRQPLFQGYELKAMFSCQDRYGDDKLICCFFYLNIMSIEEPVFLPDIGQTDTG